VAQLSAMQRLHYASERYAVPVIFQAMDAAGKDGAIKHMMSGVNPQGCQVFSFKHPTSTEPQHDFLRAHHPRSAGTRADRHLQSLLLRGGADRPRGLADIEERKFSKGYRIAYEECLGATSTSDVPWYVVPADDKENARLIVSQIVLDTLLGLKLAYPRTTAKRHAELLSIRKQLAQYGAVPHAMSSGKRRDQHLPARKASPVIGP